jgi:hypothetical protein
MITRRGLFGMLAMFSPGTEPSLWVDTDANGPVRIHEHRWDWSPFLVTTFGAHSVNLLVSLQVCSVKDCGMLRMRHGERYAGKETMEQ